MGRNTLMDEHFVPIVGYESYQVSNYGQVVNTAKGTELRQSVNHDGFLQVTLYKDRQQRIKLVHRLVAQAFFVDFRHDIQVEFLNDDRHDCSVRNLTLKPQR